MAFVALEATKDSDLLVRLKQSANKWRKRLLKEHNQIEYGLVPNRPSL